MRNGSSIDILYLVSHGLAARMILQTGLIDKLVVKGYKVAIGCTDTEDTNMKYLHDAKGVELHDLYSGQRFDKNGNFKLLRMYALEDVGKNIALLEKHKKQLRSRSLNPWKRIRSVLYHGIHRLFVRFPSLQIQFKAWEEKYLLSVSIQSKLKEIDPKLVVSTYPVSLMEGRILLNARYLGIRSVIHLLSWDNISCKGRFLSLADKYISWGPIMTKELQEYYNIDPNDIYETGVPHFDLHHKAKERLVKSYLRKLGLKAEIPYLLFGMSSPYFAPNEIDIVEKLAEWVEEKIFVKEIQLIIRPHPQNIEGNMADTSWLPRLDALKSNYVVIDYPELNTSNIPWSMQKDDMPKLSTLLAQASVSINSGSTLSIDALATETPVILSSFDGAEIKPYWESAKRLVDFPHLKKLISIDGVTVARTYEELLNGINKYIQSPDSKIVERSKSLKMHCGIIDGQSTNRVVEAIVEIIN